MRQIHTISLRQHIELISLVPKFFVPLDLVVSVVDKPLVEQRQLVPLAHHRVGLQHGRPQALQMDELSRGRQLGPVGGQIILG